MQEKPVKDVKRGGSVMFVKEAVEKCTPRRPIALTGQSGACPCCGSLVHQFEKEYGKREIKACKWCGQAFDWKKEEK